MEARDGVREGVRPAEWHVEADLVGAGNALPQRVVVLAAGDVDDARPAGCPLDRAGRRAGGQRREIHAERDHAGRRM